MNIYTVRDNLKKTIEGKEEALAVYESRRDIPRAPGDQMAVVAAIEFLKINIDELKRILQDVESCVEEVEVLKEDLSEANGRVRQLEQQASDDSWITNPDRMGGGGWTQEEMDPNRGWK